MKNTHQNMIALCLLVCSLLGIARCTSCGSACQPLGDSPSTAYSSNLDLVSLEGKCYTACLNRYKDYIRQEEYYQVTGQWYSVPFAVLGDQNNCTYFGKVLECKNGCMHRTLNNNSFSSDKECRDDCYNNCVNDCPDDICSYGNTQTCNRICRKPACRIGCEEFTKFTQSNIVLSDPITPLAVVDGTSKGSVVIQTPTQNLINSTVVSFILKTQQDENIQYKWLPTLLGDITLDLRQHSCRELSLSYAAVNQHSMTAFSPPISHCITGNNVYPDQITHLNTAIVTEDTRDGFFGHAVFSFTWNLPNGTEYTSYNEIIIETIGNKEQTYSIIINKTTTSYQLKAPTPGSILDFRNSFMLKLVVHPVAPTASPFRKTFNPISLLSTNTPQISLMCYRRLTDDNMNVTIGWNVSNTAITEVIANYIVEIELLNSSLLVDKLQTFNFDLQVNQLTFTKQLGPYNLYGRYTNYEYQIKVTFVKNSTFFWRKVPLPTSCTVSATLPRLPPVPVACVDAFSDGNYIHVTWCPPLIAYGKLLHYNVSIGDHTYTTTSNTTALLIEATSFDCSKGQYIEVKVSSFNDYGESNQSQPVLVSCQYVTNQSSSYSISSFTSSALISSQQSLQTSSSTTVIQNTPTTIITMTPKLTDTTSTTHSTSIVMSSTVTISTNDITNITFTDSIYIYALIGVICFFMMIIVLSLLVLSIICWKYYTVKSTSSIQISPLNTTEKKPNVVSAANKLAIDNIYISVPPLDECHYSTPV